MSEMTWPECHVSAEEQKHEDDMMAVECKEKISRCASAPAILE